MGGGRRRQRPCSGEGQALEENIEKWRGAGGKARRRKGGYIFVMKMRKFKKGSNLEAGENVKWTNEPFTHRVGLDKP